MALNIPDDFFSQEEANEGEGDGRVIVFETAPGTATTGTKFPNFKAREPAPTRSRQGKALRGEEPNLVRERNPHREKSLTFNLSSKSKFSPASNRFVHHQVNNLGQTLSRDIDQFIRSNPLSEGFPPAPAVSSTSAPEVRRKPKLVQEEGGGQLIRLSDLRDILSNSVKNVEAELEVFEAAPGRAQTALPPLVLGRTQAGSHREGRQLGRFSSASSSPPQPPPTTRSFSRGNIALSERPRTNIDLRQFLPGSSRLSPAAPASTNNHHSLGAAFTDLTTLRPARFSNHFRQSFGSDLNNRGLTGGRPSSLDQFLQTSDPLRRRPKASQIPRFPPVSQADFQNRELQRFLVEQNRIPNRFSSSSSDQRLNLLRRLLLGFRK